MSRPLLQICLGRRHGPPWHAGTYRSGYSVLRWIQTPVVRINFWRPHWVPRRRWIYPVVTWPK